MANRKCVVMKHQAGCGSPGFPTLAKDHGGSHGSKLRGQPTVSLQITEHRENKQVPVVPKLGQKSRDLRSGIHPWPRQEKRMGRALTWLLLLHICLGLGWPESATMEGQGLPIRRSKIWYPGSEPSQRPRNTTRSGSGLPGFLSEGGSGSLRSRSKMRKQTSRPRPQEATGVSPWQHTALLDSLYTFRASPTVDALLFS